MMLEYLVSKSWREKNGIIVHQLTRPLEDSLKEVRHERILGGLVWPTESSPGFFSIVGRLWEGGTRFVGQERKELIRLLAEGQCDSLSLQEFFRKITDHAVILYCQTFYTRTEGEAIQGYVESFRKYVSEKNLPLHVSLQPAPYEDNFLYGVQVLTDLHKEGGIEIPEDTVVFDQLSRITKSDLEQEEPEIRFFAINALRHAVNAVKKYGRNIGVYRPPRGRGRGNWRNSRARLIGSA